MIVGLQYYCNSILNTLAYEHGRIRIGVLQTMIEKKLRKLFKGINHLFIQSQHSNIIDFETNCRPVENCIEMASVC